MVKLYVRMAKMALVWQKNAFSGCSLGIRGFTHVSPYNPDVVGSPTASVFHSIERGCRHPLHVNYNFLVAKL